MSLNPVTAGLSVPDGRNVNRLINDIDRIASELAEFYCEVRYETYRGPITVHESAAESGCTDKRPETDDMAKLVWDMVELTMRLNRILPN